MKTRWLDFIFGVPLVKLVGLLSSRKNKPTDAPTKILIIKLAAVGDTIILIPVLRAIRRAYPAATIQWMVSPVNRTLAEQVPFVDRLINCNLKSIRSLISLIFALRKEKYDLVIDFEQWARGTALIGFFSGAPHRIGFDTPGQYRDRLYTQSYLKKYDRHEIDDFFALASLALTIEKDKRLELVVSQKGKDELTGVHKALAASGLKVLIHPGCGFDGKPREWPLPNYALLCHWLMATYSATIFLTSGPEEKYKTANLNKYINKKAIDLGGALSWDGLIALVSTIDVVISGNTGVMHVAAALQKKQVALHGPTNSTVWGPLNPNALIIRTSCPQCPSLRLGFEYHALDDSCMGKITIEEVKAAVHTIIDKPEGK